MMVMDDDHVEACRIIGRLAEEIVTARLHGRERGQRLALLEKATCGCRLEYRGGERKQIQECELHREQRERPPAKAPPKRWCSVCRRTDGPLVCETCTEASRLASAPKRCDKCGRSDLPLVCTACANVPGVACAQAPASVRRVPTSRGSRVRRRRRRKPMPSSRAWNLLVMHADGSVGEVVLVRSPNFGDVHMRAAKLARRRGHSVVILSKHNGAWTSFGQLRPPSVKHPGRGHAKPKRRRHRDEQGADGAAD